MRSTSGPLMLVLIHHVALYADGQVLRAARSGRTIEPAPMGTAILASDYRGATRA